MFPSSDTFLGESPETHTAEAGEDDGAGASPVQAVDLQGETDVPLSRHAPLPDLAVTPSDVARRIIAAVLDLPIASVASPIHPAPDPPQRNMSGQPARPVIDTHVILRDGDKILFSRRGGSYGHGRWHMPSGKLDQGEPIPQGAARELYEETGVVVDAAHLRLVHLPDEIIEYPEAGLRGYLDGSVALTQHGWQ